jgi:hypothetical protein
MAPSKAARCQAACLEEFAGTTGTEIIPAQLFFKQLVALDDPHARLNGETTGDTAPCIDDTRKGD